ncbi:MAG: hypothetical protein H7842_02875 [Gammaproteobacteria bacterium SHHR-1]|uniref:hypothetical protein n=1 Tax=Magnetovirga frankeli TaxID=947516 RepID=UPI0012931E71|nr:hypothetical protein D5125_16040 [gamma proteobacterium SS-5]
MQHSKRVEYSIERLCHKGCKAVWGVIHALEQGQSLEETQGLSPEELSLVLAELKQIMAVYEGSCSTD